MKKNVRRGFAPEDERQFSAESVLFLRKAGTEVRYLLNRGYHLKPVTQFVGDHYLFSERQRLALARSTAPDDKVSARKNREIDMAGLEENEDRAVLPEINIDGFNTVITLETALSGSPVFKGMDGCIRDLAGLRGTYRISVINDVDAVLKQAGYVVSSDSVILDCCRSWINLVPELLKKCGGVWLMDLDLTSAEERKE